MYLFAPGLRLFHVGQLYRTRWRWSRESCLIGIQGQINSTREIKQCQGLWTNTETGMEINGDRLEGPRPTFNSLRRAMWRSDNAQCKMLAWCNASTILSNSYDGINGFKLEMESFGGKYLCKRQHHELWQLRALLAMGIQQLLQGPNLGKTGHKQ